MKYYGISFKYTPIIHKWVAIEEGAEIILKDDESMYEISEEQATTIGNNTAEFEINKIGEVSIKRLIKNEPPKIIEVAPPSETELLQQDVGALLLESASDKAKIAELETLTGELLLEIATLKGGIA